MAATQEPARVYTVSGGAGGGPGEASYNSTSLPDILRRSGSSNKRKKRRTAMENDKILSKIELIQDFEFPEASNKIRFTRDGLHIMATGTYKPQVRVWECEQLSLKFERHTDAENVDFVLLSDDWTKSLHLQSDRSLQLHNQGGTLTSVRLPKFGRALAYHFPSAEAFVGASGNEVYRLNLHQGRYMQPFVLGERGNPVAGCNAIDVNPAHGLVSFGTEGSGVVELWDTRMRRQAGALSIGTQTVMDAALLSARRALPGVQTALADEEAVLRASQSLTTTALASAEDGLNMAVGTNTGHVLLFDLRMDKPYMSKDQGFGLPIRSLSWPGDRNAAAAAGNMGADAHARAESADKVLSADSKVVKVWDKLSGDNLVSVTPPSPSTNLNDVQHYPGSGLLFAAVEATQMAAWYVPAMGPAPRWCSFIDNVTDEIDQAGVAGAGQGSANAYEDFRFVDQAELERLELTHLVGTPLLRPYMHGYFMALKLYERAQLMANPKAFDQAKQRAIKAKQERDAESRVRNVANLSKPKRQVQVNQALAEKLASGGSKHKEDTKVLEDQRFKELFTNPEYQVDEESHEFAMLNPSTVVDGRRPALRETARTMVPAEAEAVASDTESLDPDQEEEAEPVHAPVRASQAIPAKAQRAPRLLDDDTVPWEERSQSLGERATQRKSTKAQKTRGDDAGVMGATSMSWTPSQTKSTKREKHEKLRSKEDTFGAGLSKGAGADEGYGVDALSDQARFGRTQRRKPGRSASGNVMRSTTK